MPYLTYLFCEECGPPARLDLDYMGTINAYVTDGRKNTSFDDRLFIWDYLIYTCLHCGRSYRYTHKDVEFWVRKYIQSIANDLIEQVSEAQASELDRHSGEFFVQRSMKSKKRLDEYYKK